MFGRNSERIRHALEDWEEEDVMNNVTAGCLPNKNSRTAAMEDLGMVINGIPIGGKNFVNYHLEKRAEKIGAKVKNLLNDRSHQTLMAMITICIQPMAHHWIQCIEPSVTQEFSWKIDKLIAKYIASATGILLDSPTEDSDGTPDFFNKRARLKVSNKGLGCPLITNTRYAAFAGVMLMCISRFADYMNSDGVTAKDFMPSLSHIVGKNSFGPNKSDFNTFITLSSLGTQFLSSWNHCKEKAQYGANPDPTHTTSDEAYAAGTKLLGEMGCKFQKRLCEEIDDTTYMKLKKEVEDTIKTMRIGGFSKEKQRIHEHNMLFDTDFPEYRQYVAFLLVDRFSRAPINSLPKDDRC